MTATRKSERRSSKPSRFDEDDDDDDNDDDVISNGNAPQGGEAEGEEGDNNNVNLNNLNNLNSEIIGAGDKRKRSASDDGEDENDNDSFDDVDDEDVEEDDDGNDDDDVSAAGTEDQVDDDEKSDSGSGSGNDNDESKSLPEEEEETIDDEKRGGEHQQQQPQQGSGEQTNDADINNKEEEEEVDNLDDERIKEPARDPGDDIEEDHEGEDDNNDDDDDDDEENEEDTDNNGLPTKTPPPGRSCRVQGCAKYKKAKSDGYCLEHFRIFRPGLEKVEPDPKVAPLSRRCKAEGCNKYNKARCEGLCLTCYRAYQDGTLGLDRIGGDGVMGVDVDGDGGYEDGAPPMLPQPDMPEGTMSETMDAPPFDATEQAAIDSPDKDAAALSAENLLVEGTLTPMTTAATSTTKSGAKSSKYCNYEGCTKYRQTNCYGYCLTHKSLADPSRLALKKEMAAMTSSLKKKTTNKSNLCKWQDCNKYIQSNCNGYCLTHVKFANYEEEDEEDVCKVRVRLFGRLQNGFCQAVLPEGLREEWGFSIGRGPVRMMNTDEDDAEADDADADDEELGQRMDMSVAGDDDEGTMGMTESKNMEVDNQIDGDVKQEQLDDDDSDAKSDSMDVDNDDDLKTPAKESDECKIKIEEGSKLTASAVKMETESTPKKESQELVKDKEEPVPELDFKVHATPQRKTNGAIKCKAVGCPKNSQSHSQGFCRVHHNRYLICTGQCESWECICGERIASFQARCGKCHRWRGGKQNQFAPGKPLVVRKILDVVDDRVDNDNKTAADADKANGDGVAAADGAIPETASDAEAPSGQSGAAIPAGALTYVPPDSGVQISVEPRTTTKGRSLCKVVGCSKMDQSNNDGFCRMHFNQFVVVTNDGDAIADGWTCVCGQVISGKQKRCGNCNKWKGGKREPYTVTKGTFDDVSMDNIIGNDHEDMGNGNSHSYTADFWKCDCGNEVPSAKSRCGQCHHWRGGRRKGGWKLGGVFGRGYDSDDGIDRTEDWKCCGMSLPASKTRCGKCNGWRGGKRVAATGTPKTAAPQGPPWQCAKCHISNPGNKRRCGGCLAWKGSGNGSGGGGRSSKGSSMASSAADDVSDGPTAGGWLCKKCNFDNFPTELVCMMCNLPRPNWQWHKKQQTISAATAKGSASSASGLPSALELPTKSHSHNMLSESARAQALAGATWSGQASGAQASLSNPPKSSMSHTTTTTTTNLAGSMSTQAPAQVSTTHAGNTGSSSVGHLTTPSHIPKPKPPDELNYYGSYSEGVSYPYISIHFDFNQAYYHHHKYSYLNEGINKSKDNSNKSSSPVVEGGGDNGVSHVENGTSSSAGHTTLPSTTI